MQLRPRQKDFVSKCVAALDKRGNTIGIAPTGAGKTVMLSAVAKEAGGRALILQHRDELVAQNRATFKRVAPDVETDLYTADRKRWSPGATFAMVQTLSRGDNLDSMPAFDLLVIDEAHHVAAESYVKIIKRAREINPKVKLFGVTATPQRGDRRGLRAAFDNVADVISLSELIAGGFLVRPRFFVIDCAIQEALSKVRVTANDFDMQQVEAIMDKDAVTDRVITEWQQKAGDRRTVVFCSTVSHAEHVMAAFSRVGVKSSMVHGDMPDGQRASTLRAFDRGESQVLVNVAVLTEGWDCQAVSCVVLLRPCSFKGTMIQMIGRGLRKVDPERYPGVVKSDCIVLDFGYSLLTHGSIDTDVVIDDREGSGTPLKPVCPDCDTALPKGALECPICGCVIDRAEKMAFQKARGVLTDFGMLEVDLLNASPYKWQDLFEGAVTLANGLTAWAVVLNFRDKWVAIGRKDGERARTLAVTANDSKAIALASADDFLRENGEKDAARKTKRWISEPATNKQLAQLGMKPTLFGNGVTKYLASCMITWQFNEREIQRLCLKT